MCALTLICGPPRGGAAIPIPPARGGKAEIVLHPVRHLSQWICIHRKEAAWNDKRDPYWGGLQMDRPFMRAYGGVFIKKYSRDGSEGLADEWTPREQMMVANVAYETRGFGPWPNTRIGCG